MSNWHYARGGEKHGPITTAQLKELATTGQLSPDDLVWREDMKDWRKASTVKGLFPEATPSVATTATAPPPPPPQPGQSSTGAEVVAANPESPASPFRFAWAEWNLGGKVIFVSACVALVSMLMKWVDGRFAQYRTRSVQASRCRAERGRSGCRSLNRAIRSIRSRPY